MRTILFFTVLLISIHAVAQNTNVYDFAPSAKVTTNGIVSGGGATSRSFNSNNWLTVGQYILLDCGTSIPVHKLTFGTYWSSDIRYIPKGYTLDYSNDGTTYTNVVTATNNQTVTPTHDFNVTARYWKFTVTATQDGQTGASIAGLQLLTYGVGAATNNSFWNGGGFGSTSVNYMAGNVGIGTSNPQSLLDVSGQLRLGRSGLAGRIDFARPQDGNYQGYLGWSTDEIFRQFFSGGGSSYRIASWGNNQEADLLTILNSGNVGIGTTDPGSFKLAVEGKLGARKVVVTQVSPWPDYVFSPQYRLPSLNEVERFIQANQHLPEVASAKEVEEKGLDLGDNQTVLLKKIEELTLYLIEQNKRMEQLEKSNEQLKQENQTIKAKLNKLTH